MEIYDLPYILMYKSTLQISRGQCLTVYFFPVAYVHCISQVEVKYWLKIPQNPSVVIHEKADPVISDSLFWQVLHKYVSINFFTGSDTHIHSERERERERERHTHTEILLLCYI